MIMPVYEPLVALSNAPATGPPARDLYQRVSWRCRKSNSCWNSRERNDAVQHPDSRPNLSDFGHLRDAGHDEGVECAGEKPVGYGIDHDGRKRVCEYPEHERRQPGEKGTGDEYVEAAKDVGQIGRNNAAEDTARVQHREHVKGEVGGDTVVHGKGHDVKVGNEETCVDDMFNHVRSCQSELKDSPSEIKMLAMIRHTYRESRKHRRSNHGAGMVCFLSLLDTVQHAIEHDARHKNPEMRTPHSNPHVMKRRLSIMGYTTPPVAA